MDERNDKVIEKFQKSLKYILIFFFLACVSSFGLVGFTPYKEIFNCQGSSCLSTAHYLFVSPEVKEMKRPLYVEIRRQHLGRAGAVFYLDDIFKGSFFTKAGALKAKSIIESNKPNFVIIKIGILQFLFLPLLMLLLYMIVYIKYILAKNFKLDKIEIDEVNNFWEVKDKIKVQYKYREGNIISINEKVFSQDDIDFITVKKIKAPVIWINLFPAYSYREIVFHLKNSMGDISCFFNSKESIDWLLKILECFTAIDYQDK